MSYQNKKARKRKNRLGRGEKGPAKTEPKHGKTSRWPYDESWRNNKLKVAE